MILHYKPTKQKNGAALVTVLVIVFIVMAIIADLTVTNFRVIKRLENRQLNEQATAIAYSAIDFGRAALATSGATSQVDTLKDIWAQPIPKIQVLDQIYMSGFIVDEQSKLNINDLVTNRGIINQNVVNQLASLLSYINLPQSLAYNMAYYMAAPQYQNDIMNQYTMGNPAYRPAGRPLLDLSELVLVKGITSDMVQKLVQYVTAVPVSGYNYSAESGVESGIESQNTNLPPGIKAFGNGMGVNVNTAPAEVIAAKSGISLAIAQRMLSYRLTKPFSSNADVQNFLSLNGISNDKSNNGGQKLNLGGLLTSSNYFTIHAVIDDQDNQFKWVALIYRQNRSGQWPQILWQHPE